MRKLLMTAAALAILGPCWSAGAMLTADREPEPTWYLAHVGADPCVPVTDIGADFERVYYQSGPYRTPDDVRAAWVQSAKPVPGAKVGEWRPMPIGTRAFEVSFRQHTVWILFFADLDQCLIAMEDAPK